MKLSSYPWTMAHGAALRLQRHIHRFNHGDSRWKKNICRKEISKLIIKKNQSKWKALRRERRNEVFYFVDHILVSPAGFSGKGLWVLRLMGLRGTTHDSVRYVCRRSLVYRLKLAKTNRLGAQSIYTLYFKIWSTWVRPVRGAWSGPALITKSK